MTPTSSEIPSTPAASPTPFEPLPTRTRAAAPSAGVQALLDGMTLEQKVGQLLVIGFDGQQVDPDLRRMVTETGVGGVIFFARNVANPTQTAAMTAELQAAAREAGQPGLLIAIDQEGGRVARLTEAGGFTEFPGAMAVGAASAAADQGEVVNTGVASEIAAAMAAEMRALGFNVDFAPDLDVNNNPDNPVIGLRSFSSDPATTARLGAAFAEGLQQAGIIAIGKHFPGHGDTSVDSHFGLPVVGHERARLESVEFVPFQAAMHTGVEGIMSAHVVFPAIEPLNLPATLSPRVLTGLLRNEMGYEGLIVTDSLEMGALGASGYPPPLAATTAFAAGADLLLFNRDHALHRAAYELILAQLRDGAIPLTRLDDAVGRILEVKARYGLLEGIPGADLPAAPPLDTVGGADHRQLSGEIARRSLTLVRAQPGVLPLQSGAGLLVIETPAAVGLAERLEAHSQPAGESLRSLPVRERPNLDDTGAALKLSEDGRTVIVTTSDAKTNPEQAAFVQALLDAGRTVIVIAVRNPYDLMAFPEAQTCIASYGSNPPALEALAGLLRGEYLPSGRLPVDLPGLYPRGHGLVDFNGAQP